MSNPIYVTQPFLPPLDDFVPYLKDIWDSKVLTNGGPMHERLEKALGEYLGVENVSLFANGTVALVTALQALRIKGEVITTPYSFVATAHSLLWNGIKPVFVDIEPDGWNMDPAMIEAAITAETMAIMPVHCYGTPCDINAIQEIADIYNLRIIYDAAHAFGVRDERGSLVRHGDLSILSFHATKVFTTFEGGAIISPDARTKKYIDRLKNFGFVDETTVVGFGINGKMNEVQAALGLLELKHIEKALTKRKLVDRAYREKLAGIAGLRLIDRPLLAADNFAYFPVLIEAEYPLSRDELYEFLRQNNIFARRYFYPLISDFQIYKTMTKQVGNEYPVARATAERVLCLPIYPDLEPADQNRICELIRSGTHESPANR
ncbi:MAG: aminotransferase [Halochromatium sp.]|nr:aminotransferase [Halochromatium sp.]